MQHDKKNVFRYKKLEPEGDRQHEGDGGYRKAAVRFVTAALCLLALNFHYIKKSKADHRTCAVEKYDEKSQYPAHSQQITDQRREYTEADDITEGVQLDPEAFFICRPVFFDRATRPSKASQTPEKARQNIAVL